MQFRSFSFISYIHNHVAILVGLVQKQTSRQIFIAATLLHRFRFFVPAFTNQLAESFYTFFIIICFLTLSLSLTVATTVARSLILPHHVALLINKDFFERCAFFL